ncbi:argininosuccinate lyase [Cohnella thermotolerans]|uniref:argininosuccinate lyase n=1 Tax=Cohnella thermotolerans TaxID=329858 RepID=UPI000404BB2D|nr:argininosuccinate lyase [Cohnella thermotolerans]
MTRRWGDAEPEGTSFPGKTYAEAVLEPAYNQAKRELLGPMLAVDKAHLIMLFEQGLIREEEAVRIAEALRGLDPERWRNSVYTGQFEDLFFEVEHELLALAGEAAGNLHLARSRNDMGIAIYRIALRDKLLTTIRSALRLHGSLLDFAARHAGTLMVAHTHTQQAQPTTLGHYTAAVGDSLERDLKRLRAAFANCNRSSLGAAALATSGFAVSRERVAELLAFDEVIENAYDAVSGADYVGETAAAVQLAAINLGRFVQDLLLWSTQEFGVLRVAAPYVQISSIMPQKRNPVSIEHARSLLSSAAGDAATVLNMIHNTPFGDIVDTEDDMQPYAWKSLGTLESVYRLLSKVIDTVEVDAELLRRRARSSFAPVTELADTLVRTERLSFRTAHRIVSRVVAALTERNASIEGLTLEALNEAARSELGRTLLLTQSQLTQALDPDHFVEVRRLRGGPNAEVLGRALREQASRHEEYAAWLNEKTNAIGKAFAGLDDTLAALSKAAPKR